MKINKNQILSSIAVASLLGSGDACFYSVPSCDFPQPAGSSCGWYVDTYHKQCGLNLNTGQCYQSIYNCKQSSVEGMAQNISSSMSHSSTSCNWTDCDNSCKKNKCATGYCNADNQCTCAACPTHSLHDKPNLKNKGLIKVPPNTDNKKCFGGPGGSLHTFSSLEGYISACVNNNNDHPGPFIQGLNFGGVRLGGWGPCEYTTPLYQIDFTKITQANICIGSLTSDLTMIISLQLQDVSGNSVHINDGDRWPCEWQSISFSTPGPFTLTQAFTGSDIDALCFQPTSLTHQSHSDKHNKALIGHPVPIDSCGGQCQQYCCCEDFNGGLLCQCDQCPVTKQESEASVLIHKDKVNSDCIPNGGSGCSSTNDCCDNSCCADGMCLWCNKDQQLDKMGMGLGQKNGACNSTQKANGPLIEPHGSSSGLVSLIQDPNLVSIVHRTGSASLVRTVIYSFPDWTIPGVGTLSRMNLHVSDDGQLYFNHWIDTDFRTDCVPGDGCIHVTISVTFRNAGGLVIDNRDLGILISCWHGNQDQSGTFDKSEYDLIASAQLFATASRGFTC